MVAERSLTTPKSSSSDSKMFPPGFRFHPTDEELVLYYLKRKICRRRLKPDIIAETDVYKWDPDELPGLSKLKTGDRQWFFLSPRDRKYPHGSRSRRATMRGYWKATGKDRIISCNSRSVGLKKTLVYYKGHAPCERTDWVMHEYTMDEEEMRRCPSAQDYYALYKVYKKSGPGPKNGEQYGAPFKEEDWADDECVNFFGFLDQEKNVNEGNVSCVDNNVAERVQPDQVDDIEEFLKNLADDPVSIPPLSVDDYYTFDRLNTEKEIGSTLVNHFPVKVNLPDQGMVPQPSQNSYLQASREQTLSPSSQVQIEGADVTFAQENFEKGLSEIFTEDFLEMDDLLGAEPFTQNFEKPREIQPSIGIGEVNLCNDVAMFMCDMGQGLDNPEIGMSNVGSHPYLNNVENRSISYQDEASPNEANMMSRQFCGPGQRCNPLTPESNQEVISQQISGVMCNGERASLPTGTSQNQNSVEDDGIDSWFTSALWSFVEAIPTNPASASENALVNKAFERMSSFSRSTISSVQNKDVTGAGNSPTASSKLKKYIGGMFSFSILGIFCAMLWMLIGTCVKSLGRYIST